MNKIAYIALMMFIAIPGTAWALTLDEFIDKRIAFIQSADSAKEADAFITLCNDVLAKNVGKDAEYRSVVHSARAYAYWAKKDNAKALVDAKKSIELNQKTIFGYIVLAQAFEADGKFSEAAQAMDKAAANNDDPAEKKSFGETAVKLRAKATMKGFDDFQTKGKSYLNGEIKADAMLKICNDALAKDTKDNKEYASYIYAIRSNIYWTKNDLKKAKADAQKAIENDPQSGFGYMTMADVVAAEGRYDDAADLVDKALAYPKYMTDPEAVKKHAANLRLEAGAVSPRALWKAFEENEVAAENKYKGKLIAVKGKISAITTSPLGYPEISFHVDGYGLYQVQCEFPKDARAKIAELRKGQAVLVSGVCRGMTMKNVFLKGCKVIN